MSAYGAALRLVRALGTGARRRYVLEVLNALNGVHPRQCNLCGASGLFEAAGHPPRYDARCPHCQSLDRHRLIGLLLTARPELGRDPSSTLRPNHRSAACSRREPSATGLPIYSASPAT